MAAGRFRGVVLGAYTEGQKGPAPEMGNLPSKASGSQVWEVRGSTGLAGQCALSKASRATFCLTPTC